MIYIKCFCFQIKRRPSEALPELLQPVLPITSYESSQPQDSPSGLASLESGLSHLEVDDWDFWQRTTQWRDTCKIPMRNALSRRDIFFCNGPLVNNTKLRLKGVAVLRQVKSQQPSCLYLTSHIFCFICTLALHWWPLSPRHKRICLQIVFIHYKSPGAKTQVSRASATGKVWDEGLWM